MGHVWLVQADARQIPLRDASVQCCITSPPYWGLRDYGTAQWDGGNAACAHAPADTAQRRGLASSTLDGGKATTGHQREGYRQACPRCGAVRRDQQLGLEPLHDCNGVFTGSACGHCFICHMRVVFAEVWRVLRDDGTLWMNCGDSYNAAGREGHGTRQGYKQGTNRASAHGHDTHRPSASSLKPKDLCGIPWRLALALQADGWTLRSEIIWDKPSCMPESVSDRPTRSHEQVFLLTKRVQYFYDNDALREPFTQAGLERNAYGRNDHFGQKRAADPRDARDHGPRAEPFDASRGRNARTLWSIPSQPFSGAHFATFPTALAERCIRAGSRAGAVVLDPFAGSGTVGLAARALGRHAVLCDLSLTYLREVARERLSLRALAAWEGRPAQAHTTAVDDLPLFGGPSHARPTP